MEKLFVTISRFVVLGSRFAVVSFFIALLACSPAVYAAADYQNTFFGSGEACSPTDPCKKGEICNTANNKCISATSDFFGAFGITQEGAGTDAEKYAPYRFWGNAINMLLGFLGIFAVSVIVYGGVQFMTAGGESDKAKAASKIIFYAVLGLIAIALSWLIGYAAVNTLIGMLK